ncbi:hypothetical protein F5883DRAFT_642661 [Diaporthe sp. PMI_573]|nr:hypothetical protein F5883DRAFT_642661 [Diaporthaceae sp. PMI_573]
MSRCSMEKALPLLWMRTGLYRLRSEERLDRKRRQQRFYKERRRLRENAIKATGSESDYASEACESAPQTRWRSRSVASTEAWGDCDETPECGDEYAKDGEDLFNPGGITSKPDSNILFEDEAISYPEIDLPENISFNDDFPGMSNDINALQASGKVQFLTFDGVDYNIDFDDIFRSSNAFEQPTNHGGLMPQADPNLYQAFDKDVHRYGHGDSASDDQPYDAISSMFPMERGQEMSSEQVAGCATGGPKPDAATVATSDVFKDVQSFTAPHRSQRSIPTFFSLREL